MGNISIYVYVIGTIILLGFVNVSFNISVLHVLKFEYLPVYLIKQVLKGSIGAQRANCLNRQTYKVIFRGGFLPKNLKRWNPLVSPNICANLSSGKRKFGNSFRDIGLDNK